MVVDEATWAEIRRAWSETNEPANMLAVRFQVSTSAIGRRAIREGWPKRPPKAKRLVPKPRPEAAAVTPPARKEQRTQTKPREPATPQTRVRRMLAIIDLQLEQLERDMASSEELTVQDKERLGRQFGGVIGSLEKVMEVASDNEKTRAAKDGTNGAGARAAEELRHEIAERLERLNAQWLAHEKPE